MFFGVFAIACTPQLPSYRHLLFAAAALLLVCLLQRLRVSRLKRRWLRPAATGLGVFMGIVWATHFAHQMQQSRLVEACNRQPLEITGEVVSLVRTTSIRVDLERQRFEFVPDGPLPDECGQPRRLLLSYYGEQALQAGQRWHFSVALRRPWGLSNPGSFNLQSWFALSGIDAVGSVRNNSERLLATARGYSTLHHRLRAKVSARLNELTLPSPVPAVLKAITVADKSGIDNPLWQLFQQYGVNHLLVISGLHIGLAASLGYLLGGFAARVGLLLGGCLSGNARGLGRALEGLAVAPQVLAFSIAAVYAALAGFSLATQRALVMLACFCIASLLARPSSGFNSLLLAAVVLLLWNPLALIGSGFWLSFGAVAALLWLAQWQGSSGEAQRIPTGEHKAPSEFEEGGTERAARWSLRGILRPTGTRLQGVVKTHMYMSLVMLPLGGLWFGGVSLVSPAANFFAIPLLGFWVVPASLMGALLTLLGSAHDALLWQIAAWPLEQLLGPAVTLSTEVPLYKPVSSGFMAIVLAVLAVAALCLPLKLRFKLPLLVFLIPMLLPVQAKNSQAQLTVLDVGQGTAAVFTDGDKTLVYDTGGGDPNGTNMAKMVLIPYLRNQGIYELDTLVVSHGDTDHSAGLGAIVAEIPVAKLRYGQGVANLGDGVPCIAGQSWQWPSGVQFRFISPVAAIEPTARFKSTNDNSCVLLIDTGNMTLLLAGDIGTDRERDLVRRWADALRSDVLLVAHHGSRTSTSGAWLNSVAPKIAILSSGYASRFGHPHAEVVQRLEGRGVSVRSTALEGALKVSFEEDSGLSVSGHRSRLKPWWM